jgi:prepilin-type processing-associated H-X9-DG protein
MKELSGEQKELIFGYSFGIISEDETRQAEELIASNSAASDLCARLKQTLQPLGGLETESCPDELVEGVLFRAKNLEADSHRRLEELIEYEEHQGEDRGFWRNLAEVAAIAAMIMLFAGVSVPSLRTARQHAWQNACQAQMSRIARGVGGYVSDHDGALPAVATATGEPWWKVGYQGAENHSNTRPLWLLVKEDYVGGKDFVCPGRRQGRAIQFDQRQVRQLADFPSRRYVTYSFRIVCKSGKKGTSGSKVLMADLNPVFEQLPDDYSRGLCKSLCDELMKLNSINHQRQGQNVLFCDGSVKFSRQRGIGLNADDIFTLRDKQVYYGSEVPTCVEDTFLAP